VLLVIPGALISSMCVDLKWCFLNVEPCNKCRLYNVCIDKDVVCCNYRSYDKKWVPTCGCDDSGTMLNSWTSIGFVRRWENEFIDESQ